MGRTVSPSFFIVGAPKCGTTALYTYLSQHERICMPWIKEPHYFANELEKSRIRPIDNLKEYLSLFKHCGRKCEAVGEASVFYLNSPCAIENIYSFNDVAKIIIMVRNPIDMFASLHSQLYFTLEEDLKDPEAAWRAQAERKQGFSIPKTSRIPHILQYQSTCSLGALTEKALKIFPPNQVKIILFEDFVFATKKVYEGVLAFLSVSSNGRTHFPRINENKVARSRLLSSLYHDRGILRPLWRTFEGQRDRRGLEYNFVLRRLYFLAHEMYMRLNTKNLIRPPLTAKFRRELQETFKEDVERLSLLVDRNLTNWLADL